MDVREFFKTAVGRAVERALVLALAALVGSLVNSFESVPVAYFMLRLVQDFLNKNIPNVVK